MEIKKSAVYAKSPIRPNLKERDDGGPAFPATVTRYDGPQKTVEYFFGLTKREYFAGLAMQGLIPNYRTERSEEGDRALAKLAIYLSEALLAELKKGE
jgi:hypothetical protein